MTRIVLDADASEKLALAQGVVELCNSDGRVLGVYAAGMQLKALDRDPKITDEELDQRAQSTRWYTTQEVLDGLRESPNV